ncbi:MAG: TrkH family potassium uptake protein, partial [Clostridia bacterium]|nr:TrkH family potassium uptake protein [Clostridia bacterium]
MNYKVIIHTLGWVLIVEAAALVLPLICALAFSEPYIGTFVICIAICALLGGLCILPKVKDKTMFSKEGFIIVALSWIVMSIFGALPFV